MKKKILTLTLCVILLITTACSGGKESSSNYTSIQNKTANSENTVKEITLEDVKNAQETEKSLFTYLEVDGGISITGFDGVDKIVSIPDKIDDKPVVSISDNAFINNKTMVGIKFNDSLLEVGEAAFENCTALKIVVFGQSVKVIKEYAFNGCTLLCDVVLNEGVETIEMLSFGYTNLSEIYIPDSVISIDAPFTANKEKELTIISTTGSAAEDYVSLDGEYFNIKFQAK